MKHFGLKQVTAVIMVLAMVFTCMPAAVMAAEVLTYDSLTSGRYVTDDKHALDRATGDIYYFPDYGAAYAGGVADDGYAYDADGKWISTVTYLIDKYADQRESGYIIFGDHDEMSLYVTCVSNTEGDRQGGTYIFGNAYGAYVGLSSDMLVRTIGTPSAEYYDRINEIASSIDSADRIGEALSVVYNMIGYSQ